MKTLSPLDVLKEEGRDLTKILSQTSVDGPGRCKGRQYPFLSRLLPAPSELG